MSKFEHASGQIWNGDCLELMKLIPNESVDMILCDLPYGTTRNKWDSIIPLDQIWSNYLHIIKPNGAIVLTAQCPFDKVLGVSNITMLRYEWIWHKEAGTGFLNAKISPLKDHENILIFYRCQPIYNPQMRGGFTPYKIKKGGESSNYNKSGTVTTESSGDRYPVTTLEFARDKSKIHPTQKPVALFEYLIRTYTNAGAVVLDNCSGSGTTAVAAHRAGRRSLCIEQDLGYYLASCGRVWGEQNA